MHIDRSNYEMWFIDWLDGNLNNPQLEELKVFLDQNPGLGEEFNDLTRVKLVSADMSFRQKEYLKKSPSDISQSQFEYLCAAYLEDDLTHIQRAEVLEIASRYPERKITFDLIQKTVLPREKTEYKYKSLLRKRTTIQKVIRMTVTGLSTAAAISLVIIIFSVLSRPASLKLNTSANNFLSNTLQSPSPVIAAERIIKEGRPFLPPAPQEGYRTIATISKSSPVVPIAVGTGVKHSESTIKINSSDDSTLRIIDEQKMTIIKVPVSQHVKLQNQSTGNTLVASNPPIITDFENDRTRAGKFISKTFREKFLKEKTPPDSRLKGYEIAEAGVSGLNKLLGWQMVLDKKNDGNGQSGSVYFSSKLLKVKAPVKKTEPQP